MIVYGHKVVTSQTVRELKKLYQEYLKNKFDIELLAYLENFAEIKSCIKNNFHMIEYRIMNNNIRSYEKHKEKVIEIYKWLNADCKCKVFTFGFEAYNNCKQLIDHSQEHLIEWYTDNYDSDETEDIDDMEDATYEHMVIFFSDTNEAMRFKLIWGISN